MSTAGAVCERVARHPGGDVRARSGLRLVLLLGGLIALGPLSIDLYLPALPAIAHDLRAADADIQFTLTGMLAGLAVGQVLVGPLSDAVGRRKPLIVGSAVHTAASLACAVAPTVALLDVARVLQGLGASAGAVLGMAVVRDLFDGRDSAKVMSRMILVMSASPILAPSVGVALSGFGGLPGLLVAIWLMLFFSGVLMPNAPAVVLDAHPEAAGTAAGVLGAVCWGVSAVVSPLVGALGNTAVSMSLVCAGGLVAATLLLMITTRRRPSLRVNEVVR
jgi:MFS family permease